MKDYQKVQEQSEKHYKKHYYNKYEEFGDGKMGKILTVGEPMGLFAAQELGQLQDVSNFKLLVSGAEVNIAIGVTRLDHEAEYITQLGFDPIGQAIKNLLTQENIKTTYAQQTDQANTGIQLKNKVLEGDPEIAYYRKDSAASLINKNLLQNVNFDDIDLIHITGIFLALNERTYEFIEVLVKEARSRNIIVTFDPNLRPSLWKDEATMIERLNHMAQYADYILPGISEGQVLTGRESAEDIADFYLEMGIKGVIIKNGSKGCIAAIKQDNGTETIEEPSFKVEQVVDTVGAGDGFAVGVITGLLEELPWKEILQRANAIGAIQVMHESDNDGLPNQDELADFIANN